MKGLKWKGPILDPSGYSTANRNYIISLLKQENHPEIQLDDNGFKCEKGNEALYSFEDIYHELKNNKIDYDTVVLNCVPNSVCSKIESSLVNVGISTWETDKIPLSWVDQINNCLDIQIVPSHYNKEVYEKCGIEIPLRIVPHCLDIKKYSNPKNLSIGKQLKDKYKFLSVFQWTERKNPKCLLHAYLTEFTKQEDVVLILRVYGSSHSLNEQTRIKQEISNCIKDLNIKNTPSIYFLGDFMSVDDLIGLYNLCDCFVLPSRSEGFGIPVLEAMMCNKPVITTDHGAVKELVDHEKTGFLVDTRIEPVSGMAWINDYNGYQNWGDPSTTSLKYFMRFIYENQEYGKKMGMNSGKKARDNYNYQVIGEQLLKAIQL